MFHKVRSLKRDFLDTVFPSFPFGKHHFASLPSCWSWQGLCCAQSCPTLCDPMDCSPPGSSVHGIFFFFFFSGKNTGVGCHFLLQGIFLIQGSNLCLLHCRQTLYHRANGAASGLQVRNKQRKVPPETDSKEWMPWGTDWPPQSQRPNGLQTNPETAGSLG